MRLPVSLRPTFNASAALPESPGPCTSTKAKCAPRLSDGNFRTAVLMGIDDTTLVGAPQEMLAGDLADIRQPDAVVIDKAGYEYMWPGEAIRLGRVFEMNDRRAVLVGVCHASAAVHDAADPLHAISTKRSLCRANET